MLDTDTGIELVEFSAENLTKLRTEKNLSIDQLAVYAGVSRSAVMYYERAEREPTTKALRKLGKFLEVYFYVKY